LRRGALLLELLTLVVLLRLAAVGGLRCRLARSYGEQRPGMASPSVLLAGNGVDDEANWTGAIQKPLIGLLLI